MPKLLQIESGFYDTMNEVASASAQAVTVGVETEIAGWELGFHRHEKAQLMLSVAGVALCEAEGAIWLVPSQAAVIIPPGVDHRVAVTGKIEGYAVFITSDASDALPQHTTTITVNPLLRELIVRSAHFPTEYLAGGSESKVTELLLDEIANAPTGGLHLPMPSDLRLRFVFQSMMTTPSDRGTVESWAKRAGMSQRTMARMISNETGMSFGRWRERLNIILALQWMAAGRTVEQTAFDLGYENAGSFIRMFHKSMGASPARYVAARSYET